MRAAIPRRILVADDNHDSASSLAMLLELMGHQVEVVNDGVEAINRVATFKPDVALLDIGMPELDGYEVARRIRALRDGDGTPMLVALTGWGQDEDRRRSAEAGFDAHLLKPVNLAELAALLDFPGDHGEHRPPR
jgi:CheY-like chemotaxis protein